VDNIKADIKETGWGLADWINLTQGGNQWWNLVNVHVP
jgi:hypothetical protein